MADSIIVPVDITSPSPSTSTTPSPKSTTPPTHFIAKATPYTSIPASTLARWSPRWSPADLLSSIAQYSTESGYVEGTVYQWSVTQTHADDIVFHTALDAMAATLHRSKTLFIHSPALSEADSRGVARAVKGVQESMKMLLDEFHKIRKLETDLQAWNVGLGMEEHYKLFRGFEDAVREKVVGEGREGVEGAFKVLEGMFERTIVIFKGEPEGEVGLGDTEKEMVSAETVEVEAEVEVDGSVE